jgi:preprotein translocase subunit YajC
MYETLATLLANGDGGGGGGAFLSFGILLLIPFAMYFFMIRPQRRRMREQQELQRSIQVGDEVVTTSGILGRISGEDGDSRFWLEIDDDVQIRIARAAIQGRVDESAPAGEPTGGADEGDDEPADEVAELEAGDADTAAADADDRDS